MAENSLVEGTDHTIPEQLQLTVTAHGHGDKGMAFYSYEDADGLGVLLDARRESRNAPFVETWRFRWLPDREFPNFVELRAAANALTKEAVFAEKAKWPQLVDPPRLRNSRGSASSCWSHKDRPATHLAWAQACWYRYDGVTALLCDECASAAATDPAVITRASEQRRSDVAARRAEGGPFSDQPESEQR